VQKVNGDNNLNLEGEKYGWNTLYWLLVVLINTCNIPHSYLDFVVIDFAAMIIHFIQNINSNI
jgi:hypothetical protein